ncbi:MAG: DEAD/DEAH box helicase, partial [Deltaproteobacteria bacterium]|nr:DEAD/DEAH box helicase [Deltaproteobacteria bacterium]
MTTFAELGLSRDLLKAVGDMGFEEPSPIQTLAIPPLMAGKDIIGQAQTGTGKTAAFGIPLLEKARPGQPGPQALILCPTRELTIQVAEELGRLAGGKRGLFVLPIYGGQSVERQLRSLERGPQIIVGTPGRLLDHLGRKSLALNLVRAAVLDEADEMLDMGFYEDIKAILEQTPPDCQKILFSATMPGPILELAGHFLRNPEILKVVPKVLTVPSVEQIFYEVRPHRKLDALCRVLDSQGLRKILVFCATKRGVDDVAAHLQARGYQADGLHGDLAQAQRDRVRGRFRQGSVEILVATDVAARGIDVDDLDAVINYDIPHDVENYVHRIGRTGRAGRAGKALTFVAAREQFRLREIMRYTKARITENRLPTLHDVAALKTGRLLEEVRAVMEAGALERYSALVEDFLEGDATSMGMA